MIRNLLRPIYGWTALACLALALGCGGGKKESAPTAPVIDPQLKARLEAFNERADRLSHQIASLREETVQRIAEMTSESQTLALEANALTRQYGGKPLPPAPAKPGQTASGTKPKGKGPISPLGRLMLIVIALLAIWIIARIFLGRLEDEEEEEDDDLFAEGGDDEAGADKGAPPPGHPSGRSSAPPRRIQRSGAHGSPGG